MVLFLWETLVKIRDNRKRRWVVFNVWLHLYALFVSICCWRGQGVAFQEREGGKGGEEGEDKRVSRWETHKCNQILNITRYPFITLYPSFFLYPSSCPFLCPIYLGKVNSLSVSSLNSSLVKPILLGSSICLSRPKSPSSGSCAIPVLSRAARYHRRLWKSSPNAVACLLWIVRQVAYCFWLSVFSSVTTHRMKRLTNHGG